MKICVIGFPRSRSSLLTESLGDYYQIPIIGEDINVVGKMLAVRPNWFYECVLPTKPIGHFNKLKSLLKSVKHTDCGIVRLHPIQFSMLRFSGEVLDFDMFDLNQYDQIYFTSRESVADSVSSHFVSTHVTKKFTYQSANELENNINPVSIHLKQYGYLYTFIYEQLIELELKKYLLKKNIAWVQLYYDNIPEYIADNFGKGLSRHVRTNYDYKKIIANYDSIENRYNELKSIVSDKFYLFNPQFKN